MGKYINPSSMSKEQFLKENGTIVPLGTFLQQKPHESEMYVVLVDNGPFTAAAILYSPRELKYFRDYLQYHETRPYTIYIVPTDKLKEYL